jgi:hypothetical protein
MATALITDRHAFADELTVRKPSGIIRFARTDEPYLHQSVHAKDAFVAIVTALVGGNVYRLEERFQTNCDGRPKESNYYDACRCHEASSAINGFYYSFITPLASRLGLELRSGVWLEGVNDYKTLILNA